ncbi:hypothetical protein [Pelagibacterium lentulum]|uniref:Uncharacterized protein n=1 Tax=Pelagibacterium lentulum TaxID=2029865 RepID=A0A916RMI0_9HYPH|nr:hypothetical protein [Pelagibacterium lentulum]GGA60716.1 hypothetical protein GCM10011499_33740 [Pelagibacterium lentulum]
MWTPERGKEIVTQEQREARKAAESYNLYKSHFIERMTPEEAEQFEQELNASELAKLRLMYHAVEYFVSDDPLFAVLHWELTQAFGEDRADALLARPE